MREIDSATGVGDEACKLLMQHLHCGRAVINGSKSLKKVIKIVTNELKDESNYKKEEVVSDQMWDFYKVLSEVDGLEVKMSQGHIEIKDVDTDQEICEWF